jgi:DNA invertase Pin-like site-specific DNA recombinase
MPAYVIYARKSTESDDRQVLSIDSQVHELRTLAARQGVSVAEVLTESKSAKAPGRPVFGELVRRIHRGKVNGVLCWKMDRLARNHLDTGQVLQALADGLLERVITIDRTYTRDGNDRFIGNFELGMATKYIDDLRQNVKRGLRAKLQQGWATGKPPLGYLNDKADKTIVKDPERFDLVRRMWDLMLTGTLRPDQIRTIANEEWGFRTRKLKREGGRPLAHAGIYHIFGNPFYMG